jgi:hypothetical protein
MSCFLLKSCEKVVFIGDSITDCGRRNSFIPHGNEYVKIVRFFRFYCRDVTG